MRSTVFSVGILLLCRMLSATAKMPASNFNTIATQDVWQDVAMMKAQINKYHEQHKHEQHQEQEHRDLQFGAVCDLVIEFFQEIAPASENRECKCSWITQSLDCSYSEVTCEDKVLPTLDIKFNLGVVSSKVEICQAFQEQDTFDPVCFTANLDNRMQFDRCTGATMGSTQCSCNACDDGLTLDIDCSNHHPLAKTQGCQRIFFQDKCLDFLPTATAEHEPEQEQESEAESELEAEPGTEPETTTNVTVANVTSTTNTSNATEMEARAKPFNGQGGGFVPPDVLEEISGQAHSPLNPPKDENTVGTADVEEVHVGNAFPELEEDRTEEGSITTPSGEFVPPDVLANINSSGYAHTPLNPPKGSNNIGTVDVGEVHVGNTFPEDGEEESDFGTELDSETEGFVPPDVLANITGNGTTASNTPNNVVGTVDVGEVHVGNPFPARNFGQQAASLTDAPSFSPTTSGTPTIPPPTPQQRANEWVQADPNDSTFSTSQRMQRYAMATLYYATQASDYWLYSEDWLSYTDNECDWFSNSSEYPCNTTTGALEILDLPENNLTGQLPEEIGYLRSLKQVFLPYNFLQGTLPSQIGSLANLEDLDLRSADLQGTVPTEIGLLTNLESLSLQFNWMVGPLPSELGLLTNAYSLELYGNNFRGPFPSELCSLIIYYNTEVQIDCATMNCTCGCRCA